MILSIGNAVAQIQVYSNNNIGIGSGTTNAASLLSVNCIGNSSSTSMINLIPTTTTGLLITNDPTNSTGTLGLFGSLTGNASNGAILKAIYGVAWKSSPSTSGRSFGVMGIAGNCTNGYNFGLFGQLQGSQNGAGIYSQVGTASNDVMDAQYAGYFKGDVKITSRLWVNGVQITSSDERLKKNISNLDSTDKIFSLRAVKYNLKGPNEIKENQSNISDTGKVIISSLPDPEYTKKIHYGLLAQDLQKIYPDLVYQSPNGLLGVDYQGLIPVIIEQLKKMKQALEEKDARITTLEKKVQQLQKGKQ